MKEEQEDKVKYPLFAEQIDEQCQKRQCNRTIRHYIFCRQRSTKHRIVYKSQITPNLAHVCESALALSHWRT